MSGKVGDALRDLYELCAEKFSECDVEGDVCDPEADLCRNCESNGCIQLKIRNARAALSASPQDGWVLVPREPTEAMLRAAQAVAELHILGDWSNAECKSDEERADKSNRDYYRAMIEAAPALPQPTGDGT